MILDNRFQIGRKIGRGLSGKIYEAIDQKSNQKCAVKFIEQVKNLHDVGFIHRDIKPNNILFNNPLIEDIQDYSYSEVNLIDYGISKSYLTKDGWHILNEKQSRFTGNLLFSSVFQMRFQVMTLFRSQKKNSIAWWLLKKNFIRNYAKIAMLCKQSSQPNEDPKQFSSHKQFRQRNITSLIIQKIIVQKEG
ncbi:ck1 family protein kinase [Stylonychia lemnae]|uniref:Casein kinase I n=1 Tax=Stylonychia lemnae TaxID=5949 RepID=A0A077ZZZ1_STYLE|nr:ck1 family protein kinase [Stylonychia lemnae]|eukprot:CDW75475.1 ck1 family protein kinase [Stylonychia lemnae]